MPLFNLVHPAYTALRRVLNYLGVAKLLRKWVGPSVGRFIFRMTADTSRPTVVQGHQMLLASQGGYAPVALAMDRYEQSTTRLFQRLLRPGMVVLDVGSHVGYFALLSARHVGQEGRVYAFEPEPANYDLLSNNIELNGYANITAIQTAVSNELGTTTLFLSGLDNGRHSTFRHGLPEKGSVEVESTTIDAFCQAEGWPPVDLVKIDVEGAEAKVLEGMANLLDRRPELKIIMEFSPSLLLGSGIEPSRLLQCLADRGLRIYGIGDEDEPSCWHESIWPAMVSSLLKSDASLNLLCARPSSER